MPHKGWRKENPRNQRIKFRASFDEEVRITANAATAGMSVSEYIRDRALNGKIITRKSPYPDGPFTDEEFQELKDVGELVNDLAKSSNSGQGVDQDALHEAMSRIRKLLVKI